MKKNILPAIGTKAVLACIIIAGTAPAHADFLRDFQQRTSQARENIQRHADQVRQDAQRHTDQLRRDAQRQADRVRQDAQRHTDQLRRDAQRRTEQLRHDAHRRTDQLRNEAQRQTNQIQREAAQRANQLRHESRNTAHSLQRHAGRNFDQTRNNVERQMRNRVDQALSQGRRLGDQADQLARRYQHDIERFISDPRNQERAVNAVITAGTVMAKLDGDPQRIVAEAVGNAGDNLMIETPTGREMSLNDFARQMIREQAPFLEGSSIEENPAEALTYMLVFQDADYMVNELRIIPDEDGRRVSMRDYALTQTGTNAESALQAMAMADAFSTFSNANASPAELMAAAKTIEKNMNIGTTRP